METQMRLSINSICSILILIMITFLNAEYRSGFFIVPYPCDKDTVGIDFSELVDSCAPEGGFDSCIVLSADLLFPITAGSPESLNAVIGSIDLGEFDSTGLANLDTVPTTGYTMYMTPEMHHIYAVKTTEDHYAALFLMYEYIGGINRFGFQWAYQSDGTNNLDPSVNTEYNKWYNKLQTEQIGVSPSSEGIQFSWVPFQGQVHFSLYNSLGQLVGLYTEHGEKGRGIDTRRYTKGIYFIKSNVSPHSITIHITK